MHLAAALGLHEEVAASCRASPTITTPRMLDDYHQCPQLLVLGLATRKSVESEMRRLKLVLNKPEYIRGWIAHTEDSALDRRPGQHPDRHPDKRIVRH